eukprot:15475161-Alexandrium_andersonii.AAC.1
MLRSPSNRHSNRPAHRGRRVIRALVSAHGLGEGPPARLSTAREATPRTGDLGPRPFTCEIRSRFGVVWPGSAT